MILKFCKEELFHFKHSNTLSKRNEMTYTSFVALVIDIMSHIDFVIYHS
jgi:hypothetical protein